MKDKGAKIIGGNGEKTSYDFYPTPREVTVALMHFLDWKDKKVIWEPACGECAISDVLTEFGHEVVSTDVIYGDNYFFTKREGVDAIITNPPFRETEKFILKAIKDAPVVAMLLKATYWHASKRQPLFEKHPPAWILALTWRPNFFGKRATGAPTMDFIWTVWIQGSGGETRYKLLSKYPSANVNKLNLGDVMNKGSLL